MRNPLVWLSALALGLVLPLSVSAQDITGGGSIVRDITGGAALIFRAPQNPAVHLTAGPHKVGRECSGTGCGSTELAGCYCERSCRIRNSAKRSLRQSR